LKTANIQDVRKLYDKRHCSS